MRPIVKTGAVMAVAVALTVAAAVVNVGSNAPVGATPDGAAPAHESVSITTGGGSVDETIAGLQARIGTIPGDWAAYASLGLAYVAQARVTSDPSAYPRAEEALVESLRIRPRDNPRALLGLGALALARHDFDRALRLGRDALRAAPGSPDALGVIGDALLELGRYEEAFVTFQAMVDARPDVASYARASYARELVGDVPGAVAAMEMAFDAAGTATDASWAAQQLGLLELRRGEVDAAEAWFERGLELDPDATGNLAGLGRVAWARGDAALAIERFERVVERLPSVEHLAVLADLYRATGDLERAEETEAVVRAARDLARTNGMNVDLEIALFDADHGDAASAVAAASAEWERRESIHVADAYAWALYADGRYRAAQAMMRRALALGTRDASFLFHAGMIRLALGDDAGAQRYLERALAIDPHFSVLHAAEAERVLEEELR